jgi:hypothetical protein
MQHLCRRPTWIMSSSPCLAFKTVTVYWHLSSPLIIHSMQTWPNPWNVRALFRWSLWLLNVLMCVAAAGSIAVLFEDATVLLGVSIVGNQPFEWPVHSRLDTADTLAYRTASPQQTIQGFPCFCSRAQIRYGREIGRRVLVLPGLFHHALD